MIDLSSAVQDPRNPFAPPGWLANPHVQSILPTLRVRRPLLQRRAQALLACAQEHILDCGDGVRLLGHYSGHTEPAAGERQLAVLLHGWEGSSDSMYVLSLSSHLFAHGCDVFRLNFRDHGPSHHLNQDIFHSCRIAEVLGAIRRIQQMFPQHRLTVAGFSLGGNFALRVAAQAPAAGIRLQQAVGICPLLQPHSTMNVLESGAYVYRKYFINKWKHSLRLKQQLFPELYDFRTILAQHSIKAMTELLVKRFGEFPDLDAYLHAYAITGEALANLQIPSHILFALDDPIVPARDLGDVARTDYLQITALPRGGHCGFMESFNSPSWADRQLAHLMGLTAGRHDQQSAA
jgi:predicted alpha/beta-fold hydrolase